MKKGKRKKERKKKKAKVIRKLYYGKVSLGPLSRIS